MSLCTCIGSCTHITLYLVITRPQISIKVQIRKEKIARRKKNSKDARRIVVRHFVTVRCISAGQGVTVQHDLRRKITKTKCRHMNAFGVLQATCELWELVEVKIPKPVAEESQQNVTTPRISLLTETALRNIPTLA